jgi:hypothetical protein
VPPKIRKPDKDKVRIEEARLLLQKEDELRERGRTSDLFDKLAVEFSLWRMSDHVRSEAKRVRKGETRPGQDLPQGQDAPFDEVDAAWEKILEEYEKTKVTWADPALETEQEFQKAVSNYSKAMEPLIAAFQKAQTSHIPAVEGKAKTAAAKLMDAQRSLDPLKAACTEAVAALTAFTQLVDEVLKKIPPDTMAEVKGTQARYNEAIQRVRRAEEALKNQVVAIDAKAAQWEKELERLIKEMVAAAIAWAQTENVRTGVDVVSALLNGTVSAVQTLDGEPMSALAVQGVHSLIKLVCDGVTVGAAGIQSLRVKSKDKDVLVLLDKLEADAFVQMKCDLFMIGFTWLTEPLGLIPSVGAIVRGVINTLVGHLVESIKKAAQVQAKALEKQKNPPKPDDLPEEVKVALGVFKDEALTLLKQTLESVVEFAAKPEEKALEFILDLVNAALGPPLHELLGRVIGTIDLVDKDAVKATVQSGRDAVLEGAKEVQGMLKIEISFGFDEQEAFNLTVLNLGELVDKGDSSDVVVIASDELTAAGVAILVGENRYTKDHKSFVQSLMDDKKGYKGTVVVKSPEKGVLQKGELVFNFSDGEAQRWIKDYIKHWKGITSKAVSYKS